MLIHKEDEQKLDENGKPINSADSGATPPNPPAESGKADPPTPPPAPTELNFGDDKELEVLHKWKQENKGLSVMDYFTASSEASTGGDADSKIKGFLKRENPELNEQDIDHLYNKTYKSISAVEPVKGDFNFEDENSKKEYDAKLKAYESSLEANKNVDIERKKALAKANSIFNEKRDEILEKLKAEGASKKVEPVGEVEQKVIDKMLEKVTGLEFKDGEESMFKFDLDEKDLKNISSDKIKSRIFDENNNINTAKLVEAIILLEQKDKIVKTAISQGVSKGKSDTLSELGVVKPSDGKGLQGKEDKASSYQENYAKQIYGIS